MKFLKFLLLPLLALPALILPSCSNDDPKGNTQALTIQSSLNYISVYDRTADKLTVFSGANYGVLVNLDQLTMQLNVNDLQYDSDQRAISFSLPELRMNITQTGWKLQHAETMQIQTGASTVNVANLDIDFVLRSDGLQNLVSIKFLLDSRYEITTLFTHSQFIGETKSTDIDNPAKDPFSTKQSRYLVTFDGKTKKAEVQIAYPKFLDTMPSNLGVMRFPDIPLTYTNDGFTFKISSLVPKIGNDPYPAFEITNLEGKVVAGKTLSLTFECRKFNRKVTIDGTAY